jgi:hypothetical protein
MKRNVRRALAGLALLVAVFVAGHFTRLDWYPPLSTYGVSVGTDTSYCSAEWAGWHPAFGCQTEPEN